MKKRQNKMKRVVITGASSGIGLAVAEALASRGVHVGLAARHTKSLEELQRKYPETVVYSRIDITKPKAVEELGELADKLGGMDIYFHVAGIGYDNPGLDPEREVDITATNACGFARMIAAAYLWMKQHGVKGTIAALTSVAGTNGIGRLSAYCASKAYDRVYLNAMDQLSRKEKAGISFCDIRPGWIRTPLLKDGEKYPMEMTLDYVVPQIIRAIVRKNRVAYIDWRWGMVATLWGLIPDCLWRRMTFV